MSIKMIALIGEQPIPNLLPIRHVKPIEVLLVRTDRTKQVSERLEKVVKQDVGVHFCHVDPYDIAKIYTRLTKKNRGFAMVNPGNHSEPDRRHQTHGFCGLSIGG